MTRKIVLTALIFSILQVGYSQVVNSSCDAPDSVINIYKLDAKRIALQRIMRNNLTYKDSVEIPQSISDIILNSIISIYNADLIPECDTVTSILNIHTRPNPWLNEITIRADSNLFWMQNIHNGIIPTGYSHFDSIIVKYDLEIGQYLYWFWTANHYVSIQTDSIYNTYALSNLFLNLSGIDYASPATDGTDGSNITDSVYSDHVELTFSYGWLDCMSGCQQKRFWVFNVYYDCSVEFVMSWGSSIPQSVINESIIDRVDIYPNPFGEYLKVSQFLRQMTYVITDINGKEIITGHIENGMIQNLDNLQAGVYILKLHDGKNNFMTKIIKSSR